MYARTSFRDAKLEKRVCFGIGHSDQIWKGDDEQNKKNAHKNAYL